MTKTTILAAVALAFCAGCRTDGGIDRADTRQGMKFSTGRVAMHTREDYEQTKRTLRTAPAAIVRSVPKSLASLSETYHLYLENGSYRK